MPENYIHRDYRHCLQPLLASVFNTLGEAIVVANEKGRIVLINRHVETLWGYNRDQLLGEDLSLLMPDSYHKAHRAGMQRYIETGEKRVFGNPLDLEGRHADGHVFPIQVYISESRVGEERFFTAALRDITEQVRQREALEDAHRQLKLSHRMVTLRNDELQRQVRLDSMTGLLNHAALDDRLEEELSRLSRVDSTLTLLFLDIDHFKAVNDTHGHVVGDDCLRALAELLKDTRHRPSDVVARYGGEEFAIIMPNTPLEGASAFAEQLRAAVEQKDWPSGQLTVTIGLTTTSERIEVDELLKRADEALYYGKRNGRNQVNSWQQPGHAPG